MSFSRIAEVVLLPHVARRDDLAERRTHGPVLEEVHEDASGSSRILTAATRSCFLGARPFSMRRAKSERRRAASTPSSGPETETSPPGRDRDAEGILDEPEVFVVNAEETLRPASGRERNG
jgi:hypothetical protein